MKKLFFSIVFALVATITMAQQELVLNLNKGDVKTQTVKADMLIKQSVMGVDVEVTMNMDSTATFKVNNTTNEKLTLDVKYDKLEMVSTVMGSETVMSSEAEEATPPNLMFKALTEQPFSMTATKNGQITSVDGYDEIVDKMVDSMKFDEDMQEQFRAQMKEALNEETFQQSYNFDYLPGKAINVGDSWSKTTTRSTNGMEMTVDNTFTLREIANGIAVIDLDSKVGTKEGATIEANGMQVGVNLAGDMTGNYNIDITTGWINDATIEQNIEGSINVEAQGLEIPMSLISTITIK